MLQGNDILKIKNARMINFGSGPSAYAFDYESAGVNGVNMGMTPSAFGMEIALLKEYADVFQKGSAAVFAICPFSFGENSSNNEPWRYERYYPLLSRKSFDNLPFPLPRWDEYVFERMKDAAALFPYENPAIRDEIPSNAEMDEKLFAICNVWKNQLNLENFTDTSQTEYHKDSFMREKALLTELLSLAKSIGLRPFLMLPPLHPKLRKLISPEFFDAFVTDNIKDCGVPVLDYTADSDISEDMFTGPVFLNKIGAKYLTKSVWDKVNSDKN